MKDTLHKSLDWQVEKIMRHPTGPHIDSEI